jgi:hypothetical protein
LYASSIRVEVQTGSDAFMEDSGDLVVSLARIQEDNTFPTPEDLLLDPLV